MGLACIIFGIVSIIAALISGDDSSAILFNRDFPPVAQIVCGAAVTALGVFFMVRNWKED